MAYRRAALAAVLADVHGNLPALSAVLAEPDVAAADAVVLLGDIALGPMPAQTLEVLAGLGERAIWVHGNCEREMVAAFDGAQVPGPNGPQASASAALISRRHRDMLDRLPLGSTDRVKANEFMGRHEYQHGCLVGLGSRVEICDPKISWRRLADAQWATIDARSGLEPRGFEGSDTGDVGRWFFSENEAPPADEHPGCARAGRQDADCGGRRSPMASWMPSQTAASRNASRMYPPLRSWI
jgi:hypothetical protein